MPEPVTVFMCRRRTDGPSCTDTGCHDYAVAGCAFELGGKKAGQVCGRKICGRHGGTATPPICSAHQRLLEARASR